VISLGERARHESLPRCEPGAADSGPAAHAQLVLLSNQAVEASRPSSSRQAPRERMNNVTIRTARPDEKAHLESLQRRASLANPGDRDALLANPDAIELPSVQIEAGCVFVAEEDGAAVGFAAILPGAGGNSELDALFVEPREWRKGIGRCLVDHCAQIARGRGATAMFVVGNPHAEAFYRSCGFHVVGSEQTRFGPALRMLKPL